eukprot:NODE_296_length_11478_cov_0.345197.p3 type:complete len:307 gc:universal NODE_296_length_11478_cov_0.345197:8651-7731(-)
MNLYDETVELIEGELPNKNFVKTLRRNLKALGIQGIRDCNMDLPMRAYTKAFSNCINANPDAEYSKVHAVYLIANLQMASHFLSNSRQLCGNIINVIESRSLPDIQKYPIEDQLLYNYYCGLYYMSDDHLEHAYRHFSYAFGLLNKNHKLSLKILHRLIPLKMLKGEFPSRQLYSKFPQLEIYSLAIQSAKSGNLKNFNNFMTLNEAFLTDQETLFAFEKVQFIVLRNLLKKTYQITNVNSQVKFEVFKTAVQFSMKEEIEDVQYYNWMSSLVEKGYLRCNLFLSDRLFAFDPGNPCPKLDTIPIG